MTGDARRLHVVVVVIGAIVLSAGVSLGGESASNGVYGGYVGSTSWFSAMRRSAENRAMISSLAGRRGHEGLPAGYVEFAGQIVFPDGNPFPDRRLPDLRIVPRDRNADPVERAPRLDRDGAFYTIFRKGETYDLYWMYYFGSRERFATIHVRVEGPRERKLAIPYRVRRKADTAPSRPSVSRSTLPATEEYRPPAVGEGYRPPAVGEGYRPPTVGPGYLPPGSR